MDKAGLAFLALIFALITIVLSILAVDRPAIEAPPNRAALVRTNYP
ncbi:hypothetical protein ABIE78_006478 [Sinorhizobium fredii]|jgi:hypothetical protein|uniref:Uncharacterized protein n=1 Tax=Sinorhizobium fredii (strain USDA 257) TaxID=1185652 RepID=I3XDE4_SINF2|nr:MULTISPECIES: hypothetical protein [Sinorhizobium]AFL53900.1 hypothetical protein USDA257_c53770 [Sinorhizobium fredii USDA 257]PDT80712.1 hypothetical protein CO676_26520 [Sinorhizobium sp. BJ1]